MKFKLNIKNYFIVYISVLIVFRYFSKYNKFNFIKATIKYGLKDPELKEDLQTLIDSLKS